MKTVNDGLGRIELKQSLNIWNRLSRFFMPAESARQVQGPIPSFAVHREDAGVKMVFPGDIRSIESMRRSFVLHRRGISCLVEQEGLER